LAPGPAQPQPFREPVGQVTVNGRAGEGQEVNRWLRRQVTDSATALPAVLFGQLRG